MIGPMPGIWARRWLGSFCRCQAIRRASTHAIRASQLRRIPGPEAANISRASSGTLSSSSIRASSGSILLQPLAATSPNSAA